MEKSEKKAEPVQIPENPYPKDSAADDEDGWRGVVEDGWRGVVDNSNKDVEGPLLDNGQKVALESDVPQIFYAPDGGWGWVVVVSALVVSLIVDGLTYTFGLFLGEFEKAFQAPKSTVALASSLQVGIYLMIGPVVSALTNRFGCRPVIIAGSLLASAAFILSSFSPGVTTLILTYGVLGGMGFGMMYLPAIVAVSLYFERRRAVATGIAVCGSGIGTFLLAPATEMLLDEYNWSWTLMILGAIILNGVVFGALVRPLQLHAGNVTEEAKQIAEDMVCKFINQSLHDGQEKDNKEIFLHQNGEVEPMLTPSKSNKTKKKRKISTTSSGRPAFESIPAISITDDEDNTVIFFPGKSQLNKPAINTSCPKKTSSSPQALFSSTPTLSSISSPRVKVGSGSTSLAKKGLSNSTMECRTRSNTFSTTGMSKTQQTPTSPPLPRKPRGSAPIGLAYISVSDFQLNKMRDDFVGQRKDTLLSAGDVDMEAGSKVSAFYLQSVRSLASSGSRVERYSLDHRKGLWKYIPRSAVETLQEMLSLSILKDLRYWFVLLGNFTCMIGFYVPFVYIPERAKLLGIEEDKAAFLLSIIGISNTVGRVLTGFCVNFFNIDSLVVNNIALFLCGVMTIVCPLCHTYDALAGVSAVFGLCVAAYISLCSLLLCELLGVQNLTNAFGFVTLFRGVACIIGPPVAGALIDATGIFDPAFYVGGGFIVVGALSHMMLHTPCIKDRRRLLGET